MFCPNCGEKLDDEDSVCSECGFDIKNDADSAKSSNESSGNKNIVIGGLIVVAILILVAGIASLNSSNLTLNGVNFNIPEGFEENVDLRKDDEPIPYGGSFYARYYDDGNGNVVNVAVSSNFDFSSADLTPYFKVRNAVEKNIGGKDGWLWIEEINMGSDIPSQYAYCFSYLDGENQVIITASEENRIEEVIV